MTESLHQIVHPLVDHDAIRAASNTVQGAIERSKVAESDLAAAGEAWQAANYAHQVAVHDGNGDPVSTKRALAEASEALELAQEIRDAREHARLQASTDGIDKARRHAYGKVMIEGLRRRMDAIRAGEIANKALAGAETDFKLGTAMLNEARANGVLIRDEVLTDEHGLRDRHGDPTFARTEEHERAVWGPTLNVEKTLEKGEVVR